MRGILTLMCELAHMNNTQYIMCTVLLFDQSRAAFVVCALKQTPGALLFIYVQTASCSQPQKPTSEESNHRFCDTSAKTAAQTSAWRRRSAYWKVSEHDQDKSSCKKPSFSQMWVPFCFRSAGLIKHAQMHIMITKCGSQIKTEERGRKNNGVTKKLMGAETKRTNWTFLLYTWISLQFQANEKP